MEKVITLIYGDNILDDWKFCEENEKAILKYSHGIMTLIGAPLDTLVKIASDPLSVPGWRDNIERNPADVDILRDFFLRMVRYKKDIDYSLGL